jgi:hypothetical protein
LDVLVRSGGTESGVKVLSPIRLDHVSRASSGIEVANCRIPRVRSDGNIDRHFVVHGKLGLSANAGVARREVGEMATGKEDKLNANPTNSAGSTGAHDFVSTIAPKIDAVPYAKHWQSS